MTRKHTVVCLVCICLVVILLLLLNTNIPGIADDVQISVGSSERFTQDEIESAMDVVVSEFDMLNRELIYLWYDEDLSNQTIEQSILEDIEKDSTIVLFSTITVINPGLFPPADLDNLGWVLVQDPQSGEWELYTSGFAGVNF